MNDKWDKLKPVEKIFVKQILEALENNNLVWRKTWNGIQLRQCGKPYRGLNQLLLTIQAEKRQFKSKRWFTQDWILSNDNRIRKEEYGKYGTAQWVSFIFKKDKNKNFILDEKGHKILVKYSTGFHKVWNGDQLETPIFQDEEIKHFEDMPEIENILIRDDLKLLHGGNDAYYSPSKDYVQMPNKENFESSLHYFYVLGHERIHQTGHKSRLNRFNTFSIAPFGSKDYSKEELIAEMGIGILFNQLGIMNDDLFNNTSAYIKSWLSVLKDNPNWVLEGASKGAKAVDWLLGITYD